MATGASNFQSFLSSGLGPRSQHGFRSYDQAFGPGMGQRMASEQKMLKRFDPGVRDITSGRLVKPGDWPGSNILKQESSSDQSFPTIHSSLTIKPTSATSLLEGDPVFFETADSRNSHKGQSKGIRVTGVHYKRNDPTNNYTPVRGYNWAEVNEIFGQRQLDDLKQRGFMPSRNKNESCLHAMLQDVEYVQQLLFSYHCAGVIVSESNEQGGDSAMASQGNATASAYGTSSENMNKLTAISTQGMEYLRNYWSPYMIESTTLFAMATPMPISTTTYYVGYSNARNVNQMITKAGKPLNFGNVEYGKTWLWQLVPVTSFGNFLPNDLTQQRVPMAVSNSTDVTEYTVKTRTLGMHAWILIGHVRESVIRLGSAVNNVEASRNYQHVRVTDNSDKGSIQSVITLHPMNFVAC